MLFNRSAPLASPVSIALACAIAYSAAFVACWSVTDTDRRIVALALAGPLIWLTVADLRAFIIPDSATALVAAIGLVHLRWNEFGFGLPIELGAAAVILGLFWLIGELHWRSSGQEALGIGDAKLLAAGSLCVGIAQFWLMLLLASVGGIIAAVLSRKADAARGPGIAFGPFLAFAIFLVFLVGAT